MELLKKIGTVILVVIAIMAFLKACGDVFITSI